MKFLTPLEYDDYCASGLWITRTEFVFEWRGRIYRIPAAFVLDFYSVPWFVRWVMPSNRPKQNKPALIHDFLRRFHKVFSLSVKDTDVAFLDAMAEVDMRRRVRRAKYRAVRIAAPFARHKGDGTPPRIVRRAMKRNGDDWKAYARLVNKSNGR